MAGISFTHSGSFDKTDAFLARMKSGKHFGVLHKYGAMGVAALAAATPADTGLTANSWSYSVVMRPGFYSIRWDNNHVESGVPIAIILQYGHGTKNGGYVSGREFINSAIHPIFEQIANEVWREVTV
jgi:hypothetical protein